MNKTTTKKMTALLGLSLTFFSMTFGATAKAIPNLGKDKPFQLHQICTISGTDYSIVMQLSGTEHKGPLTYMWERKFIGTMRLIDGLLPLDPFYGEGREAYTGKHFDYLFSGKNSNGRMFSLEKRNPYTEPKQLSLEANVNGGISFEFSEDDLICKSL